MSSSDRPNEKPVAALVEESLAASKPYLRRGLSARGPFAESKPTRPADRWVKKAADPARHPSASRLVAKRSCDF